MDQIKVSEKYYSDQWEISSNAYNTNGFYDWCVQKVSGYSSILEVGTGIGICTERLINRGSNVTTIEENQFNFQKALMRLKRSSIGLNIVNRNSSNPSIIGVNNLVFTNFILDETLHDDVLDKLRFDAIICWFMGVHILTHERPEFQKIGYNRREPATYRDFIYDRIVGESSKSLSDKGIINVIERTEIFDSKEKEKEHIETFTSYYRLEEHGLKINDYDQLVTQRIETLPGIKMQAFDGDNLIDRQDENPNQGLTSITIVKV